MCQVGTTEPLCNVVAVIRTPLSLMSKGRLGAAQGQGQGH